MDRGRKFLCRAYFTGCTNANPVESERQLLGFLTEPNHAVGAIHLESDAGDPDDAGRNRNLDDGATRGGAKAAIG
jgi:hypothetical protein